MADTKISGLTALTGANTASGDLLTIVDISDTTMAATGTNKKITLTELQGAPVSAGTANGVLYLNGSKVATSGSALTFDGTSFSISGGTGASGNVLGVTTADNPAAGRDFIRFTRTGGGTAGSIEYSEANSIGLTATTAALFKIGGSEQMRLTSTGLGIGTSSPGAKLDVSNSGVSQIAIRNTSGTTKNTQLIYADSGGNKWQVGMDVATNNGSTMFQWYYAPNAVSYLNLDSSGNLLVGTTSVAGAGGFSVSPNASVGAASIYFNRATSTSNSFVLDFRNAASTIGYIAYNNTTVTYATSSDYRLKNTIAPMTGALAKVALLKPCTYKWNADGSDGEGFIAHELAEVVPQAVTGQKDAVDEEGNPKYQGIDTSFLVATLTAAIQELKAEFDAYKASHP
jgi:hypothetical protein